MIAGLEKAKASPKLHEPAYHNSSNNEIFLRWSERLQKSDGRPEQVIKELKFQLRKAPEADKPSLREELKFAKDQKKLINNPY